MADYSELKRKAQEIKDEVKAGANTANRVGLALEETAKALEAENKRAEQAEESLENAVQMLQDETEDLQSIRDDVERLGSDKADKSALEATNKEVSKKQNKLDNYKEDPSNGSVEIFAQDKVSVSNDSQGGVSCVEVYNEEDTAEGLIPVARMSADKENGDCASVTVKGNEVHIDGDAVKVNGEGLESFRTTVVNDLTTGGADKALSAEMGKVLGVSVDDLEERIYDLGDFGRSSQAEAEAGKADIAGNPGIVLIRYTVGNKNGIILQQVGETITNQILFWDSVYQRHINFSGSDKTSVSSTSYWYKTGATHTSYDAETRCLHLQDMNYSNLNPSIDAVLPLASEAKAGLMSKEQVAKLRDVVGAIVSRESDGVSLLENGNIKLTLKGTTREFMPATPSGDPMHYAYETAGAEYNAATEDMIKIIKVPSWETYGEWIEEEVVHKAGHWMLNNIGDIDNNEMRNIYDAGFWAYFPKTAGMFQYAQGRTNLVTKFIGTYYNVYNTPQSFNNTKIKNLFLLKPYTNRTEVNQVKFENMSWIGQGSTNLINIYGIIDVSTYSISTISFNPINLARVTIIKLSKNIDLSFLNHIEKVSIKYMIDNATPTTSITITLHTDRYAQLAEDADIIVALEAKNAALEGTGGSISLVSA